MAGAVILCRIRQELARQFAERGLDFEKDRKTSTAGIAGARAEMNSFSPHMTLMKTTQATGTAGWQQLRIPEQLFQDVVCRISWHHTDTCRVCHEGSRPQTKRRGGFKNDGYGYVIVLTNSAKLAELVNKQT